MSPMKKRSTALAAIAACLLAPAMVPETASGSSTYTCNGTWQLVPSRNPSAHNYLFAVTALSPTDAWAVGGYLKGGRGLPLAEHWDGSTWKAVHVPAPFPTDNELHAVSGTSSADVWAVGWGYDTRRSHWAAFVVHWDGISWRAVRTPRQVGDVNLRGVYAAAPDDVWAVGVGEPSIVEHWDGTSWSVSPIDINGSFNTVAGTGPTDVWALGGYQDGNHSLSLAEHWDGSTWTQFPAPNPLEDGNWLFGSVALTAIDAWSVGYT